MTRRESYSNMGSSEGGGVQSLNIPQVFTSNFSTQDFYSGGQAAFWGRLRWMGDDVYAPQNESSLSTLAMMGFF